MSLPALFQEWFFSKGWQIYPHQLSLISYSKKRISHLLIAPTGSGKTLSGFLPSLISLSNRQSNLSADTKNKAEQTKRSLHTLYISPLKALAVDVHRNLQTPITEMGLNISCETRTGDTRASKRNRQKSAPPDILLTTPESLELMLAWPEAHTYFVNLKAIIIDEIHTVIGNKRGDLLSLSLSSLRNVAPDATFTGLSATVAAPEQIANWLAPEADKVAIVAPKIDKKMELEIYCPKINKIPFAGHSADFAVTDIYEMISTHKTSLIFVNTRAQAEILFQSLWKENSNHLHIGLHHGSLDASQRRKVEKAMSEGSLDAVVATSSLDLGIDWADIDLVIQVGAAKGTSRLIQRIGRAGHQLGVPSKAILVPTNRFEVIEAVAAKENIKKGKLDSLHEYSGSLDVLAQFIVGRAVSGAFSADDLYQQICTAPPYRDLHRDIFEQMLEFVSTGGYALEHYEQFRRIVKGIDGLYRLTNRAVATRWRMNIGTIVETSTLKVRFSRGPALGEIEEYFIQSLRPGDSFIFAGRVVAFVEIQKMHVIVQPTSAKEPKVPAYAGGRLPLTADMSETVRHILQSTEMYDSLPNQVKDWLAIQKNYSKLPDLDSLLVETFPRGERYYLVAYGFEGRNAHQTLGMLITRRMERAGLKPLGFVATDYAIAIWSLLPVSNPAELFSPDILGDELEEWMAESTMLKRSFRQVATISGLIDKNIPGTQKTGKQVTINSDLIYDVLRKYQPDHILLQATRQDSARGLTDIHRLATLLTRFENKITHVDLSRISALAVPLLLEVGRESVMSSALETMLEELEYDLVNEIS
ncbi:ligase-associated DNA damage response DEXH box helicase [Alphaproteobacteria bacterium]|nr:ligase-associated DNA damage response DEXH box helicase [Alphaproteobacteria bacterium]